MAAKNKYKVIVAHPSKQHSFYTATALEKSGCLEAYITTIYDKHGSITNRLKKFLKGKDLLKASTRSCKDIPENKVIQFYEFDYLCSIFLNRFPRFHKFREWHRMYVANKFGKKVVNYIASHPVDAIIMYDSTAYLCFKLLKERFPNVVRILDVSIASRPFMKKNFERDMELTGTNELYRDFPELWDKKKMYPFIEEINLSDYFFVPSNVVKKSLVYCGQEESKISVIPYGVDVEQFNFKDEQEGTEKKANSPLRLIYVGQVTYRKGIHHLLNVIKRFDSDKITLELIGSFDSNSSLYKNSREMKNVKFCGFVTRDKLADKYQSSDLFVFPTLGEGFGLVVLEALGCGVPVLCSTLAGGDDAIEDGINGYKFDPFNEDELYNLINGFLYDRSALRRMKIAAHKTAQKYTWDSSYTLLANSFISCMERNKCKDEDSSCRSHEIK